MKTYVPILLGGVLSVACGAAANAQNSLSPQDTPKTRADVIAEISAWRAAGYNPIIDLTHYPDSALRAASVIGSQHAQSTTPSQ